MRRMILAAGVAVMLAATGGAAFARQAQRAPTASPAATDQQVVTEAYAAFQSGRYAALTPRLGALQAVLARAPAGSRSDIYPSAALMLGSYAVEYRRYDEAVRVLERGLTFQPDNVSLLMERGQAFLGLRRPADALGSFEAALSSRQMDARDVRSRALRARGVALIDLHRLDDAEASLNASLRLDPNNAATQNELQYIAGLRRGGNASPADVPQNGGTPSKG